MRELPDRLLEAIDPGDSVLCLCPRFDPAESPACVDLLSFDDPANKRILSVTYTQSPADRRARWQRYAGESPAEVAFIDVNADRGGPVDPGRANGGVKTVTAPDDLTNLGVRITQQLGDWQGDGPDPPITVCFHSLTHLLQYASRSAVLRFLRALTAEFDDAGAIAHFHMDPIAHREETIENISGIVDVVCSFDGAEWTIRRR